MTEVKIATIRGKAAKRIAKALDETGVISWCRTKEKGRKVLYVYAEKRKKKWNQQIDKQEENALC